MYAYFIHPLDMAYTNLLQSLENDLVLFKANLKALASSSTSTTPAHNTVGADAPTGSSNSSSSSQTTLSQSERKLMRQPTLLTVQVLELLEWGVKRQRQ